MLLTLNPGKALELIEPAEIIREDQVIPGHFRPCPASPYKAGFDWLYRYERKIAPILESLLRSHYTELFGEKGLLCEALSNAFHHAHQKNTLKPITVSVLLGRPGLMIRVADCGNGFNVQKIYRDHLTKRRFFTSVGEGIRLMDASPHFGIFYNRKGSHLYLLYLFENNLTDLSSGTLPSAPEAHALPEEAYPRWEQVKNH